MIKICHGAQLPYAPERRVTMGHRRILDRGNYAVVSPDALDIDGDGQTTGPQCGEPGGSEPSSAAASSPAGRGYTPWRSHR